jgi:hypothetical protein
VTKSQEEEGRQRGRRWKHFCTDLVLMRHDEAMMKDDPEVMEDHGR